MAEKLQDVIDKFIEGKILDENLEDIVSDRFGRYSKYIIQDRALPDVRDGLKPVQRRILFAMHSLGLSHDKPYKKSARIVGDVIGKYHPHGDSSVYEALVRLSQDFKMRAPLIDMHGNKGSIDGDSAAAMRYTEARMSLFSEYILKDIDKRTVDYVPNFDDEEYEPIVLPARFPNVLVNGATGISAGYATEIPPHNLEEIVRGVIKRLDSPNCGVSDIMKIVKGPDFPTGAIVQGKDGIQNAFETGKGRIIIKSKVDIEGQDIVVTEIPYEVNKAQLVRRIDEIRLKKKVDGIKEVRDESNKEGLRVVVEVKKSFDPEAIENFLHKKTDLTKSYNYNMVAINNKRPETMNILNIFDSYIYHQKEVVTNRSNFELRKARKRLHIVEGIIKMVDILDEVIKLIRASKSKQDAKSQLVKTYSFTEEQAEAILTLQLYRLSHTDLTALKNEKEALEKEIEHLNDILQNEDVLEKVIKKELREVVRELKTPRRTQIEETIEKIKVAEEELVESEQVMVALTKEGYVKHASMRSFKATEEVDLKENDAFLFEREVNSLDTLLIFTDKGNYVYVPVFKIPQTRWKELGVHLNHIVSIGDEESVIHVESVKQFDEDAGYLLFSTKNNLVKVTDIQDLDVLRHNKPFRAINLNKGDEVCHVARVDSLERELLTITREGYALRYHLRELPVTGPSAKGVKAIGLYEGDELAVSLPLEDHHDLLIVTSRGTIKRINLENVPRKRRTLRGERLYKQVKSSPYYVKDACLMNAVQYKKRAKLYVVTTKKRVELSAFSVKTQTTETGKKFIRNKDGVPLFMSIENVKPDEEEVIAPISNFEQLPHETREQQTLFDEE